MKPSQPDICFAGGDSLSIKYNVLKSLVPKFIETVRADLDNNVETFGMVFGYPKKDVSIKVTTIVILKHQSKLEMWFKQSKKKN